ncbi:MAG: FMN-binding negative transcriptional regulator [Rhodoferax sp.]|nr:FMN-binding negative transcriptional regulator [Rhodoferax sp.]
MYLPPQFDPQNPRLAHQLMRQHPFASLVSVDDNGLPFITHLPLHLDVSGADVHRAVLLGHCARGNTHWKYLAARPQAVVSFMGPHAYMSPKVYPDLARVPTWNYVAVHCTVQAEVLDGHAAKDALLKQLIADHEPAYAQQWRSLPEDYTEKMLNGIVAFSLKIISLQCKVKVNQHRPEVHARMLEIYDAGSPDENALGQWMRQLGLGTQAQ